MRHSFSPRPRLHLGRRWCPTRPAADAAQLFHRWLIQQAACKCPLGHCCGLLRFGKGMDYVLARVADHIRACLLALRYVKVSFDPDADSAKLGPQKYGHLREQGRLEHMAIARDAQH
jgi:hypothetical protein